MAYLWVMTVTGSFLYMVYMAWGRLCRKYLTQAMKYRALEAVLLSYVVPWVWIRGTYRDLARMLLGRNPAAGGGVSVGIADIEAAGGGAYRTAGYWQEVLVLGIWLGGAAWHMSREFAAYLRGRRALLAVAEESGGAALGPVVKRLRKEFRLKRRLRIIETRRNSSLTIGTARPVIALQRYDTARELEWILRHEMVHIARMDQVWKVLMELVRCLQWFNPLARRLKREFEQMCETSCDERVLRGCSAGEREAYGRLVIKSMRKDDPEVLFGSALGDDQKNAEERIDLIIKPRRIGRVGKAAGAGIFTAVVMASSLTAFAYPDVYHVEDTAVEVAEDSVGGSVFWAVGDIEKSGDVPAEVFLYDEQFVDEAGGIYPVNQQKRNIVCNLFGHDVESGYYQTHVKDDNGGCATKSYDSTRCLRCNTIWVGDWVSTHTYATCPH